MAPSYGSCAGNKDEILSTGMIRIFRIGTNSQGMVYRMDRIDSARPTPAINRMGRMGRIKSEA